MSDEIRPAPNKVITVHQSDDDIIVQHLRGKLDRSQLSPKLQEMVDQMNSCYKLIQTYVSRMKVCPMLETTLGVSRATAYRIYDKTQRLFGETSIKSQPFWVDIELGELEKDIQAARKIKDFRSVAALRKLKQEYIRDMGSGDAQIYEKIQPPPFVIGFFPRSMKVTLPKDKELKDLVSEKLKKIADDVEEE